MCNRRASRAVCDFCSSRPAASSIDSRCFVESKTSLAFLPKACGMGREGQCSNFQTAVPTFLDVCKSDVHTRFLTEASRNWAARNPALSWLTVITQIYWNRSLLSVFDIFGGVPVPAQFYLNWVQSICCLVKWAILSLCGMYRKIFCKK